MASPRRFAPDLLESSTSSSSSRKPRRFAPEPLETTTRHGGGAQIQSKDHSTTQSSDPAAVAPKPRKFAPQLVQTTSRHGGPSAEPSRSSSPTQKPRRRFAPVPVETTTRSRRNIHDPPETETHDPEEEEDDFDAPLLPHERMEVASPPAAPSPAPPVVKTRRKFAPQLIETATRTHKAGDTLPALLPSDKTNVSPGDVLEKPKERPTATPLPPANTPFGTSTSVPTLLKPYARRQGSIRPHYTTRANTRQHSYKVPELDDIESSESGGDDEPNRAPSLSRSHSASSLASSDEAYKHATRLRESVDDRFSGYLLALAARAAEKQLREQEAAAFANSDFHDPVAHYVDESDEDVALAEPTTVIVGDSTRRDSADEHWALQELQKHGEQIRKEMTLVGDESLRQPQRKKTAGVFNVEFDDDVMQDAWVTPAMPKNLIGGYQRDPDLKQMRKAASPPMLGGDIEFPRCPSPEHARFDVTQGSAFLKTTMCYLTEQGLWGGAEGNKKTSTKSGSLWGDKSSSKKTNSGLWGGLCTQKDAKVMQPCAGIMTPIRTPGAEKEDPFSQMSVGTSVAGPRNVSGTVGGVAPPSPPASSSGCFEENPEAREIEAQLDTEFSDATVTQVYNYLSLGYPALARKFDEELSKISRVPIEELRQDDQFADTCGYLRLDEEENWDGPAEQRIQKESCKRWLALRIYVREWGRQMVGFEKKEGVGASEDPNRAWGMPARKGSWGL